jgi:hypothetical protein
MKRQAISEEYCPKSQMKNRNQSLASDKTTEFNSRKTKKSRIRRGKTIVSTLEEAKGQLKLFQKVLVHIFFVKNQLKE